MGLSGPSGNGARSNGQDNLRAQLGDLLLLCRDLTPEEETVCRLKYGAQGRLKLIVDIEGRVICGLVTVKT